jgi:hypothetical protein
MVELPRTEQAGVRRTGQDRYAPPGVTFGWDMAQPGSEATYVRFAGPPGETVQQWITSELAMCARDLDQSEMERLTTFLRHDVVKVATVTRHPGTGRLPSNPTKTELDAIPAGRNTERPDLTDGDSKATVEEDRCDLGCGCVHSLPCEHRGPFEWCVCNRPFHHRGDHQVRRADGSVDCGWSRTDDSKETLLEGTLRAFGLRESADEVQARHWQARGNWGEVSWVEQRFRDAQPHRFSGEVL